MSNIQIGNTPVSETFSGTGTVTVPTGEVWNVTLWHMSDSSRSVALNGTTIAYSDRDGSATTAIVPNLVVSENDTFGFPNDDGNAAVFGWKISEGHTIDIENDIAYGSFDENNSFTVPSGETWAATFAYSGDLNRTASLNGTNFAQVDHSGGGGTKTGSIVLTGGDTIACNGGSGVITGFVV